MRMTAAGPAYASPGRAGRAGGAADHDRDRAAGPARPRDDRARPAPPVAVADPLLPADGEARVRAAWSRTSTATSTSTPRPASRPRRPATATRRSRTAIAAQAEVLIHICGTDFHYPGYGEICEKLGALAQRIGPEHAPLADVPHQLGHRGGRGGDQAGAPPHRAAGHHRLPRRLPRAHARVAVADRQQVEVPARASGRCCPASTTRPTATPPASRSCSRP